MCPKQIHPLFCFCPFWGSSEIWSDKLKRLYNKAHRATERTEIKAISRRCRWHIERRRRSVQIPDNFCDKWFEHKSLTKFANFLRSSLHRRCLRAFHFVFNNPPFTPYLCVTLRQSGLHQNYEYSKEGSEIYLQ